MRRLPRALEDLQVVAPCQVEWSSLTGGDQRRHCGRCEKAVVNVAGFTRWEAEQLLLAFRERHCLRVGRLADGTVVTRGTLPGALGRARGSRGRRVVVAAASAVAGLALTLWVALQRSDVAAKADVAVPPPGLEPLAPTDEGFVIPTSLTLGVQR